MTVFNSSINKAMNDSAQDSYSIEGKQGYFHYWDDRGNVIEIDLLESGKIYLRIQGSFDINKDIALSDLTY